MDSMLKRDPNHCPDPDYDRTTSSTLQSTKHNDHPFMGRTGRLMGGPLPDLVVRAPSRRSEQPLGGGRQAQPHSQKGSRPVDKWLAEPEPSFYKRGPATASVGVFVGPIQTVTKLKRNFVIKFSEADVYHLQSRGGCIFANYRIPSHSDDVITTNLLTGALSATHLSAPTEHACANEAIMKLAKKKNNVPILSFEIFSTTHGKKEVRVGTSFGIVGPYHAPAAHQDQRCRRAYAEPSGLIAPRANLESSGRIPASTDVTKESLTWDECSYPPTNRGLNATLGPLLVDLHKQSKGFRIAPQYYERWYKP
ncbi:hypothetical protein V8E53_009173 [Lactarius tabidus]